MFEGNTIDTIINNYSSGLLEYHIDYLCSISHKQRTLTGQSRFSGVVFPAPPLWTFGWSLSWPLAASSSAHHTRRLQALQQQRLFPLRYH